MSFRPSLPVSHFEGSGGLARGDDGSELDCDGFGRVMMLACLLLAWPTESELRLRNQDPSRTELQSRLDEQACVSHMC